MWRPRNNVTTAVMAIVVLVALGTVGYRVIEGWAWFDCFYMTIITLATIGYKEPEGITFYGRAFTATLIVGGVGIVGYAVSLLAQAAIQVELLARWERRRVQERIKSLTNHIVICGAGRVGLRVASGLVGSGVDFVIVERERERLENLPDKEWLVVLGDATREDVLQHAGVARARGLVAALPTDADNVFIALTARELSSTLLIVTRANDEFAIPKMRRAGADKIISPLQTGAHQIVQALLRPTVAQFIELATMTEGLDLVIEEVHVSAGSSLAEKKLVDTNVRRDLNTIVIAIKRDAGDMIFNPNAMTVVHPGDKIIAIGKRTALGQLAELAEDRRAQVT